MIVLTQQRLANEHTRFQLQTFVNLQRPLFLLLKNEPGILAEFKHLFPKAQIENISYFEGATDFQRVFQGLQAKIKTYLGQFYGYGS